MSPIASWDLSALAVAVALLGALAVAGVVRAASDDGSVTRALAQYATRLERDCRYLRLGVAARSIVLTQAVACTTLLGVALWSGNLLPVPLSAAALLGPGVVLGSRRLRRTGQIDGQLDRWLLLLANALRSNPALGDALAESARMTTPPIREELELALREHHVGASLGDALGKMAARINSRTVDAAITALAVARRSGGDLPETLETAAASLREMARLEGVLRTKTAEGKAQALVIGAVPAPLIAVLHSIDPTFLAPLSSSPIGRIVLAAVAALWLSAIALARRIVAVDL